MKNQTKNAEELEALRGRFEEWRRLRPSRRTPIPETLLAEARDLARRQGVFPVARELRLNYRRLKGFVVRKGKPKKRVRAAFVELKPALRPAPRVEGVEMELTNASGEKLAIRLPGGASRDVMGLAAAFLDRRR